MYGYISWTVYQSQIHCGSFTFQLSRYGFQTYNHTNTGYWSVSQIQDSNPDINYMRLNNVYNQSWGNATCFISAMIFPGGNVTSISSDYLTRVN
jgi:hypothetical protein